MSVDWFQWTRLMLFGIGIVGFLCGLAGMIGVTNSQRFNIALMGGGFVGLLSLCFAMSLRP